LLTHRRVASPPSVRLDDHKDHPDAFKMLGIPVIAPVAGTRQPESRVALAEQGLRVARALIQHHQASTLGGVQSPKAIEAGLRAASPLEAPIRAVGVLLKRKAELHRNLLARWVGVRDAHDLDTLAPSRANPTPKQPVDRNPLGCGIFVEREPLLVRLCAILGGIVHTHTLPLGEIVLMQQRRRLGLRTAEGDRRLVRIPRCTTGEAVVQALLAIHRARRIAVSTAVGIRVGEALNLRFVRDARKFDPERLVERGDAHSPNPERVADRGAAVVGPRCAPGSRESAQTITSSNGVGVQ